MVKYKKIYINYFDYVEGFIPCEVCGFPAVSIHHVKYKSRGGKDDIENLMALCMSCHNKAHNEILTESQLREIHLKFLKQ